MSRPLALASFCALLCACSPPASSVTLDDNGDPVTGTATGTATGTETGTATAPGTGTAMGAGTGAGTATGNGTFGAVTGFANPGALGMYAYVPGGAKSGALVVALHGCTQTANAYQAAGWSAAADVYGFVVLYPEQRTANNQNRCFNWFTQEDTLRNGESKSIASAIQATIDAHGLDARRVYVTGLSAGGAMTAVLLAGYPDRGSSATTWSGFAGGAIMAGLPFGAACTGTSHSTCPAGSGFGDAFTAMNPGKQLTPVQWGDRLRAATPAAVHWPRVSIWAGSSDTTVAPANLRELVDQFTDAHGISAAPSATDTVRGAAHEVYADASGQALVEAYRIPGMTHGTAIDPSFDFGAAGKACGSAAAYILDKGICSTYYALLFWGEAEALSPSPSPTPSPSPSPTPSPSPSPTPSPSPVTCIALSASNYAHVQAGRAFDQGGVAYAKGSGIRLGLCNLFYESTLHAIGPDAWALGPCR